MDIAPPKEWAEISESEFEHLIGNLNWQRQGMGNGEWYEVFAPTVRRFGVRILGNPNRCFIDPVFFKKAL